MNPNDPQPPPKENAHPYVWPLVIADMKERDESGFRKYGIRLQPFNGRDVLIDAYQEALDLVVYLRQMILERSIVQGEAKRVESKTVLGETSGLVQGPQTSSSQDSG